MATEARNASVDVVGDMAAWGAHFCLFYETKQDLLDTLISYCKAGLEREEYCLWIVAEPLTIEEARNALRSVVPDLDRYFGASRLEIVPARDWFLPDGTFDGQKLTSSWYEKLASLSARGYPGMRITGDTTWLTKKEWTHFCDYEDGLNEVIGNQRLAVLCTYPLAACGAPQILDVVRTHQFVLARRHGNWDVLETATLKRAKAELKQLNQELKKRVDERTSELRRSEAYLAEAQRLSHTGSWASKAEGNLYWSEENFRIWGLDPQQDAPNWKTLLQLVHSEDRDRVRVQNVTALREGRDYNQEFRIVLSDGTVRHVQAVGHPVYSESGELIEVVGTHVDVTERKRAEEERERLRQLEADLAHLNRVTMMGELAASLAHEIKQPMSASVMHAQTCARWLQRDQPDVAEARAAASRMIADAKRAVDIVDRVRSLYKRGAASRDLIDVNEVIREMSVLLYDKANQHSVSIRAELDDGLTPIAADRVQLQQVLMNLMLNGIEAMKDTGGKLLVTSKRTDDGQFLVSVSDSGVGLPAGELERIFETFFTTKAEGSGMGLPISRKIIESHGGRLWASPNSDRGATFHFTVPAAANSTEAAAAATS
jgi:PAS domain S-box-containing protein